MKIKKTFALCWLLEPLEASEFFLTRSMFGCLAGYLGDLMVVVLAENKGDENWNGILFPVERERHPEVLREFPELRPHAVLGKWLYLPMDEPRFEELAEKIVNQISLGDPRWGVVPEKKKSRAAKKRG